MFSNRAPDCLNRPVNLWSREDVSSWLCFFGLSRFVSSFVTAGVDGPRLLGLFMNPVGMERLGVIDDTDKQQLTLAIQPMMMTPSPTTELGRGAPTEPTLLLRIVDSISNETGREMVVTATGGRGGRSSESNDIVLLDTSISRSHFTVSFEASKFSLTDNGSSLGTFLMVREEVALEPMQVFQFGSSELRVAALTPSGVCFDVLKGSCRQGDAFCLSEGVIGRDPLAHVSFSGDQQVSHKHAEVVARDGRYYLRDTESTNSTWMRLLPGEGVPITAQDVFKLGSTVILVAEDRRPAPPSDESEIEEAAEGAVNENIRDEDLCKLCFDRSFDTVMIPCGHMVVCRFCGKKCKDCPICRKPFDGIIRTFKA